MKIRYEKKNEIKTDHFWNLPNIDDTISNYFVVMQRTSNILITKKKEKLCQETFEKKNEIKTDHLWNDGCRQLF